MSARRVRANNPITLIIVGIVILLALGGGGYWYYAQQQAAQQQAMAATAVAQTATGQAVAATAVAQTATSAAATAAPMATSAALDAELERQYQAALDFQKGKNYAQAQEILVALIAARPGYKDAADVLAQVNETMADAYYQQGVASLRAEQWADAIKQFELALAVIPNYKDAATKRAEAARQLKITPTPTPIPPTATPDPAATPVPASAPATGTAVPTGTIAFRDTFDKMMSEEWQIVNKGLSVVNGQLVGREGFLIYKPDSNNYTISTQISSKQFAIIFRSDGKVGYNFHCKDGNCEWRTFGGGNPVYCCNSDSLSSSVFSAALNDGEPHMVTVEVQGEDFLAYVDGDLLISVRDKTHTKGSVGLWAGEWATFDDFTVELQ